MKGNVVIGQSGGPTAVINASLAGAVSAARDLGAEKIYGMHYGIQGFLEEDLIDLGTCVRRSEDLELLKRTPSAFLGSCRYKLPKAEGSEEVYEKIFAILDKYGIGCMLYIGGNDSMDTVKMLSEYAAAKGRPQRFVGIPKTIDNDLPVTDHCPGYGSAAKFIATAVKEVIRDNESFGAGKPTVCIIEIMGRNAGWLTAASALCRGEDCVGPDLIYLPETTFDPDDFMDRIRALAAQKRSVVVAAAESIHLADGRDVCDLAGGTEYVDSFGHKQQSGCASVLANMVSAQTGLKSRAVIMSSLQRAASHMASAVDIEEAFSSGYLSCKAAAEGKTGCMTVIRVDSREPYQVSYDLCDIAEIANIERTISAAWITGGGTDVSEDFLRYARPLIRGELNPIMVNGVPRHMVLPGYHSRPVRP